MSVVKHKAPFTWRRIASFVWRKAALAIGVVFDAPFESDSFKKRDCELNIENTALNYWRKQPISFRGFISAGNNARKMTPHVQYGMKMRFKFSEVYNEMWFPTNKGQ